MADNAVDLASPRLRTEEGFRSTAYRDTRGLLTIGYGFCVDRGITQIAASALLQAQLQEIVSALRVYPWFVVCDPVWQSVLIDLAFNDGIHGLLHFVDMLAAIRRGNWLNAKTELLNSDAARENPHRYQALAQLLLTGSQP